MKFLDRSKYVSGLRSNLVDSICIVSIIRLRALVYWTRQDGTYANSRAILWTSLESSLGIICACIVVMRPLFGKLLPKSHMKLGFSNPKTVICSRAPSSSVGGRQPWAPSWVQSSQNNALGMNNALRQAEPEEGPAQARRFPRIEQHLYQPKAQALATNITTVEVGSDAGGSTIVNGDVENFPHHPKRSLSPGAIMVKKEWDISSSAI